MSITSNNKKIIRALPLIGALVTPIFLWLFTGPPLRLYSASAALGAIGQLCAITGVVLFALQFVLAARYKRIESLLQGLNRVYTIHHMLGGFAFILILFHPISFFAQYALTSLELAFQFLFPPITQLGVWLGLTALSMLIILLIITYFAHLKYEAWKFTHQFLGISFIVAFAHTLLVPSTLVVNQPLKIYVIAVYCLGTYSFIYQKVLKPLFAIKHLYKIDRVTKHPDSVHEIVLTPLKNNLQYEPGQFAFITFKSQKVTSQTHPFSFTSKPADKNISFAIKSVGDFTSTIGSLRPGEHALIEGPYGHFTQSRITGRKQIWIAGGIGITPFMSFVRSFGIDSNHKFRNVHLFYSVNVVPAPFTQELANAAKHFSWFNFNIHNSTSRGRLTLDIISKKIPKAKQYEILLCGPLTMMKSLQKQAQNMGYQDSRLYSEEFRLYS